MSRRSGAKGHGAVWTRFSTPRLGVTGFCRRGRTADARRRFEMMIHSGDDQAEPQAKIVLRPIIGLTGGLPKSALEPIVIEAIRKHRYLREVAEMRHAEASQHPAPEGAPNAAMLAYVRAMIDVHAQQTVLSTLLDVLGHVPEMPAD